MKCPTCNKTMTGSATAGFHCPCGTEILGAQEKIERKVETSNAKIKLAISILSKTERGCQTLRDLKIFLNANQQGLDMTGADATTCLVEEFFLNHRRGFLP